MLQILFNMEHRFNLNKIKFKISRYIFCLKMWLSLEKYSCKPGYFKQIDSNIITYV